MILSRRVFYITAMAIAADLFAALKTVWTANATPNKPLAAITGPYRDRAPAQVVPAEIVFPVCVVKGRKSVRTSLTNMSEYWRSDVVFEVRDKTAALAEASLTGIVAVYGASFRTAATSPQSTVAILSIRAIDEDNKQEKEQVEVASAAYRITWSKPREDKM